ncbi:MAG: hypothetical protein AAB886_00855, partial [Patescibacteria group bacterium]
MFANIASRLTYTLLGAVFVLLGTFFIASAADATPYYWVGGAGDGALYTTADKWTTTPPGACGDNIDAGTPGVADTINMDADCDSPLTIPTDTTVTGLTLSAGYIGT